jgi:hypothetical protein
MLKMQFYFIWTKSFLNFEIEFAFELRDTTAGQAMCENKTAPTCLETSEGVARTQHLGLLKPNLARNVDVEQVNLQPI